MTTDRLTDRSRKVLDLALREALQLGHNYVAPEHILLGLLREGESMGYVALAKNVDVGRVRTAVLNLMRDAMTPSVGKADRVAELERVVEHLSDRLAALESQSSDGES